MSWTGKALMSMALEVHGIERETNVDLGKLRHMAYLRRYMRPEAEKLNSVQLGKRIDDGLVELILLYLQEDELGAVDYEKANSDLQELAEGMREHPALKAFEEDLREKERIPLASETYLKLAIRHINRQTSRGTPYDRRLPSRDEAHRLARVMLAPFMTADFLKKDWGRQGWDRRKADSWLRNRKLCELLKLIRESRHSQVTWDALVLISKHLAKSGEEPPQELLKWSFEVFTCTRKRPEEGPADAHRRRKLSYTLRDNEFRNLADLLKAVGMGREAACDAMEIAFPDKISKLRVRRICAKPFVTELELGVDAMKFVEPRYFEYVNRFSSNTGASTSP